MSATLTQRIALPQRIAGLDEMAHNLWWSWQPEGDRVFSMLDPLLWRQSRHNPVRLLREISTARLETASSDFAYLAIYDDHLHRFQQMLSPAVGSTWMEQHASDVANTVGAYFSAEFGLHATLPIYSGGLGVLSGDHIKESSDLGLPLVAVSLLYRQGYLRQYLNDDGWQQDVTADLQPSNEPPRELLREDGSPLLVEVTLDDPASPLKLAIWCVNVGRVELYLLDSDVEGNPDWTRQTSSRLYGGDREHRLRQEIVLGVGGVRALSAVGIRPTYWHGNEGHAAFHLLERCRMLVESGSSFEEARSRVSAHSVFTSHTPVPAGHDVFPPELMDTYFSHYWPQLGLDRESFLALGHIGEETHGFNMTALSMRLSDHRNAVSKRHGEVTRQMWQLLWPEKSVDSVPVVSVTNGVHLPTWISDTMGDLYERFVSPDWRQRSDDAELWRALTQTPAADYWIARLAAKRDLVDALRTRTLERWVDGKLSAHNVVSAGPLLDPEILTIGFARRFATYKRATLLFQDADRLARILTDPEKPVQIIFAGKAHPADDGGKKLIQEIIWRARDHRFGGRIAFAEDYDVELAEMLVSGVDVWLNNPRAPLEASGTSGMKAAANGAPNLSILDGWWSEGWDGQNRNGWGIPPFTPDGAIQDMAEANAIYQLLEEVVAPMYYRRNEQGLPLEWIEQCKRATITNAPQFSASRMVKEYVQLLYRPAIEGDTQESKTG